MNSDVVIIGGGIAGFLSAYELLQRGVKATIVERGECGRESSWAGGGILSPLYPWRYPEPVTRLASWGQARYEAFANTLYKGSGTDPEWLKSGLLFLDTEEKQQAREWAEKFDISLELIDSKRLSVLSPSLKPVDEAIWMPDVAQMRNPRLMQSLKQFLLEAGIKILENTPVTGLKISENRLTGIKTPKGDISANRVVLTGGAWSREILGEELGKDLRVEPVRGQMLIFKASPDLLPTMVLNHGKYLIPRKDGHILIGSTLEYVGFQKDTTPAAFDELKLAACDMLPELAKTPIEKHWSGLRPGSPEGIPYIGPHPEVTGLFVNTGHFRNGVVLGLASASLLADLVTNNPPELDPCLYKLDR
ncbi:MAG: glycine oxidase ThiO [Gammaproteobacteria bacterium]|nr:glycine oxidase ThiO [Gammaproteobacteria bacterium]